MVFPVKGVTDIALLLLQAYFNYMELSGKTEEETEKLFYAEKEKFKRNTPDTLPEPPE